MSILNKLLQPFVEYLPENNRVERIWKLAQVDFKKRYYNDRFGMIWALINPLFRILVFYFVFKTIMEVPIANYAIFLFAGLVLWMSFSEGTNRAMHVLRQKRYLISNIQFNHRDLFISHTLGVFLGFGFTFCAYLIAIVTVQLPWSWNFLYVFVLIVNLFLLIYGTSLILATLNIFFNDIHHAWEMLLLLGFWTAGIFFDVREYLEKFPIVFSAHPFVGLIVNMREVTMYGRPPDFQLLFINMASAVILLIIGNWLFSKYAHLAAEKL